VKISKNPVNGDIKFVSLSITYPCLMVSYKSALIFIILFTVACKGNDDYITTAIFGRYFSEIEILKGHVKKLTQIYEAGGLDPKSEIIDFDSNGNQIQSKLTNIEGVAGIVKYTYKYESDGKKTIIPDDRFNLYKFEKNGHIAESISYIDNTIYDSCKFYYDSAGDIVESVDSFSKMKTNLTRYKYNSQHLLIESDEYQGNKHIYKVNYEYKSFDEKGNWTQMVFHSKDITRTVIRHITYY
jgi:hypothetical protein